MVTNVSLYQRLRSFEKVELFVRPPMTCDLERELAPSQVMQVRGDTPRKILKLYVQICAI